MCVYEIMVYIFPATNQITISSFLKKMLFYSSVLCSSESFVDCSVVSFGELSLSTCIPSVSVGFSFLSLASGFVVDEPFFGLEDDC